MKFHTFSTQAFFNWDPREIDWSCVDRVSTKVNLQDPTKGGLDDDPLQYEVCPKDVCLQLEPEFEELMLNPLLMVGAYHVSERFMKPGSELVPMPGSLRAININTLRQGQKYQKHTDGNLVTVAIQLTECTGGNFEVFDPGSGNQSPQRKGFAHFPGFGLIFPGGVYPHLVRPVVTGISRMLLFSYGIKPAGIDRELEQQLYGR